MPWLCNIPVDLAEYRSETEEHYAGVASDFVSFWNCELWIVLGNIEDGLQKPGILLLLGEGLIEAHGCPGVEAAMQAHAVAWPKLAKVGHNIVNFAVVGPKIGPSSDAFLPKRAPALKVIEVYFYYGYFFFHGQTR